MEKKIGPANIDEYIAGFAPEVQTRLVAMRALIRATAPDAVETISYGIPTFDLNGKHLVHFGGFAHHIGFYPTPHGFRGFDEELAHYKQGRGSVQFPHTEPLPEDLIRRMVEARLAQVEG